MRAFSGVQNGENSSLGQLADAEETAKGFGRRPYSRPCGSDKTLRST